MTIPQELEQVKTMLAASQQEVVALKEKISTAQISNLPELDAQLTAARQEIASLQGIVSTLQNEKAALESSIETKAAAIAIAQVAAAGAPPAVSAPAAAPGTTPEVKITGLQKTIAAFQKQISGKL